jgi:hypothetical protein
LFQLSQLHRLTIFPSPGCSSTSYRSPSDPVTLALTTSPVRDNSATRRPSAYCRPFLKVIG